jgi:hypothetical protein
MNRKNSLPAGKSSLKSLFSWPKILSVACDFLLDILSAEIVDDVFRQQEVIGERDATQIAIPDWALLRERSEADDRPAVRVTTMVSPASARATKAANLALASVTETRAAMRSYELAPSIRGRRAASVIGMPS